MDKSHFHLPSSIFHLPSPSGGGTRELEYYAVLTVRVTTIDSTGAPVQQHAETAGAVESENENGAGNGLVGGRLAM